MSSFTDNNYNQYTNTTTMMNNNNIDFTFVQGEGNLTMERLSATSANTVARRKISPGRSLKKGMTLLPADFEVSKYSVLCGRGKGCYNACGNRRLRVIVSTFLQQYIDAQNSPHDKSRIIEKVVKMVKEACPVGAFINYENGAYYELSHKGSKEKVAALFRDHLISTYKEKDTKSKQAKQQKQRPSLALSAPQFQLPMKQTFQPPQQSLHQFQIQLFQQQTQHQRQQQTQEEAQFPVFGHVTPVATSLQRETSDASVASQDSSSTGSFYDVDTNRSVSIPAFDDEIGFIGIDSLMG